MQRSMLIWAFENWKLNWTNILETLHLLRNMNNTYEWNWKCYSDIQVVAYPSSNENCCWNLLALLFVLRIFPNHIAMSYYWKYRQKNRNKYLQWSWLPGERSLIQDGGWCFNGGGGLWVPNTARLWSGSLQGKVKSPSSSTSGGDSPVEMGPPTPISSGQVGEASAADECASSASSPHVVGTHHLPQEKPQRPFSLKVWMSVAHTTAIEKFNVQCWSKLSQYFYFTQSINSAFMWILIKFKNLQYYVILKSTKQNKEMFFNFDKGECPWMDSI